MSDARSRGLMWSRIGWIATGALGGLLLGLVIAHVYG